jgi:hypothetical protein
VQVLFVRDAYDIRLDTIIKILNGKSKAFLLLTLFHFLEAVAYQRCKLMVFGALRVQVPGDLMYAMIVLIQSSKVLSMRGPFVENSLGL